jgi:hypothetical protein
MKRLLKPLLYAAALLLMSVGCNKKDPCDDGSCCGAYDQKLSYVTTLENARADVWGAGGTGLVIENAIVTSFCHQQQGLYEGKLETTYIDRQPQPFKYRVWGKVYSCDSCPSAVIGTLKYVYIDKIEKVN